ncbi:MAG: S-layer homology domain-containing protein [Eubacteriales bacterium]|nr:S-layer homology domain-containing protein [Eubacteriales bacterium]
MKRKRLNRVVSLLAGICLLLALLPPAALAEDAVILPDGLDLTGVTQDTVYRTADGLGTAEWDFDELTLTLKGAGEITGENTNGVSLPGGTIIVAAGADWTVTGGELLSGVFSSGMLTIAVEARGRLTAAAGDGASLYSGIRVEGGIKLENQGEIFALGGKTNGAYSGAGIRVYDPGLTVSGTGVLRCEGNHGITAMATGSGGPGSITIEAGVVWALGTGSEWGKGIDANGGNVTVAAGADVTGIGAYSGIYGNLSGEGADNAVSISAAGDLTDQSGGLALQDVAVPTFYADVGGGTALWEPCTGENSEQNPHTLTLTKVAIDNSGGHGIELPQGYSRLVLSGENKVAGQDYGIYAADHTGSAGGSRLEIRGDGSLTAQGGGEAVHACRNSYFESADEQSQSVLLYGLGGKVLTAEAGADAAGAVGLDGTAVVDDGTARLPGGMPYFHMAYVAPGADAHVLTVRNGTGGGVYRAGDTVKLASALQTGDFQCWSDVSTGGLLAGVTFVNGTSARSEAVEFEMPARRLLLQAMDRGYTPPNTGGSSGPRTYTVAYKGNFEGAPSDVRDSGYRAGAEVTAKPASTFAAPAGKAFAGWAESADGKAVYQAGDKFKMPAKTLNLYAVWQDTAPALNKTDHIAYIQGYADGTVRPMGDITREEAAMLFYRLLDEPTRARYETDQHEYPDVAAGRWSNTAIATLTNADILRGYEDGAFRPEGRITRAEFAAVAVRFGADAYGGDDLFLDIAPHWARNEINRAADKGWLRGDGDGRFRPDDPITRAEAVALVNRMLERAPETAADLLDGMKTFTDNADPAKWYHLDLQEAANGHDYTRKADNMHEIWTSLH